MFFYEWLVPILALMVVAAVVFYLSVRNRVGAGIRTDGEVLFHRAEEEEVHSDDRNQ